MKTFYLKQIHNDIDVILKFDCYQYEQACDYFSSIKNLSIYDLLKIYVIV
jgi:hypothetical protein